VLVSTGSVSTGWLSSGCNMASGVAELTGARMATATPLPWEARELRWVVREPFASRSTGATIVAGRLGEGELLELESQMPVHGVIFSDGIEQDFLNFNSGGIASVGLSDVSAQLVVGAGARRRRKR